MSTTYRAVEQPRFGSQHLSLTERPVPVSGENEIAIRLTAASVTTAMSLSLTEPTSQTWSCQSCCFRRLWRGRRDRRGRKALCGRRQSFARLHTRLEERTGHRRAAHGKHTRRPLRRGGARDDRGVRRRRCACAVDPLGPGGKHPADCGFWRSDMFLARSGACEHGQRSATEA